MDINSTPVSVKRALRKLGQDLKEARKKRWIPMWLAAERAGMSRATLSKIEKGDEGVSIASYAKVFFILGLLDRLLEVADPRFDAFGLAIDAENLPKRIRVPRREKRGEK